MSSSVDKKKENHITQNDPVSLQINAMQYCVTCGLTTAINNTQGHLSEAIECVYKAVLSLLRLCAVTHNASDVFFLRGISVIAPEKDDNTQMISACS